MSTATASPGPVHRLPPGVLTLLAVIVVAVGGWFGYQKVQERRAEKDRQEQAKAMCNRWADELDKKTTPAGVYIRWDGNTLPEQDPWGRNLQVSYSQGGMAEMLEVRSLGPDGESHTNDDIVAQRIAVNLKGVGHGIQENIEKTSEKAGRGFTRGIGEGVKELVQGKGEEKKK